MKCYYLFGEEGIVKGRYETVVYGRKKRGGIVLLLRRCCMRLLCTVGHLRKDDGTTIWEGTDFCDGGYDVIDYELSTTNYIYNDILILRKHPILILRKHIHEEINSPIKINPLSKKGPRRS